MTSEEKSKIASLTNRLSEAASIATPIDLPTLAEMHSLCEAAVAAAQESAEGDEAIEAKYTQIGKTLEHMIMGEASDADEALQSIRVMLNDSDSPSIAGNSPEQASPAQNISGPDESPTKGSLDNPFCEQVRDLLNQVLNTSAGVAVDDLTVLAKIHGMCESVLAMARPNGEYPCEQLTERMTHFSTQLEQIILGTADDCQAVLQSLKSSIATLCESIQPAEATQPATEEELPAESLADLPTEEVVAKLDAVFEETPADNVTSAQAGADEEDSPTAESKPPVSLDIEQYESQPLFIDAKELDFVGGFAEEAQEHIDAIESALLEVEQDPGNSEYVNDLFRPFHTIKGMAGFLNLRDINCLTHEVETLLDQGRRGEREITSGIIDLVFEVVDILKAQLAAVSQFVSNPTNDPIPQPPVSEMINKLRGVVSGQIDPEAASAEERKSSKRVGEELVESGAVDETTVAEALNTQQMEQDGRKIGEVLMDMGAATPRQVHDAIRKQPQRGAPEQGEREQAPAAPKTGGELSVRVDTAKLDALVDMVGELVIAQTLVGTNPVIVDDPRLNKDSAQVSKIVRDVQEVAMSMRMIPIKNTFQKMGRLVRDLSRKSGKKVNLKISGEETELDKNVIQQIGDPLVHMVRNAVDHGIELPETRHANGKSDVGNIHLSAFHHSGNVVIEITDDGKGLDPASLIAKGIERGIVSPDAELSDEEAFQLIFAPGFSTAAQITDISGRGVGMDVVRRNIEQLRGKVEITSEEGKGSVFTIRLPLTLAIIDGMVVKIGVDRYIIPTTMIEQSIRPQLEQITSVQQRGEVLQVRGELVPLIPIGQMFGTTARLNPTEAMVVVCQTDGGNVGIVVDEMIGQQQVVIKTLGEKFSNLRGISGAAILGDGRIGLILDPSGVRLAHKSWQPTADTASAGSQLPEEESTESEVHQAMFEEDAPEQVDEEEQLHALV